MSHFCFRLLSGLTMEVGPMMYSATSRTHHSSDLERFPFSPSASFYSHNGFSSPLPDLPPSVVLGGVGSPESPRSLDLENDLMLRMPISSPPAPRLAT